VLAFSPAEDASQDAMTNWSAALRPRSQSRATTEELSDDRSGIALEGEIGKKLS